MTTNNQTEDLNKLGEQKIEEIKSNLQDEKKKKKKPKLVLKRQT